MSLNLHEYILSARQAVLLYVRSGIAAPVLNTCIQQLEKGIPVELFLNKEHEYEILQNPFLFNKCLLFIKKGGTIKLDVAEEINNIFFILDYKSVGFGTSENDISSYENAGNEFRLQESIARFYQKRSGRTFLQEANDISITLHSDKQIIRKGEEVVLSWDVMFADKVMMQGKGEIASTGKCIIKPEQSSVIMIGAYNKNQSSYTTLFIKVIEELELSYDIGFLSPVNKQFSSLVNSATHPDVFGVLYGHRLRFSWEMLEAESILISPFGLSDKKGVYEFTPETSMDIEITARSGEQTLKRIIQIKLFPVKIFKEKILTTPDLMKKVKVALSLPPEHQWRTNLDSNTHWNDHKETLLLYQNLVKRTKSAYQKHKARINFKTINDGFFSFLKKKNSQEPGVSEILQSLSEVYEQRNRAGTDADRK